MAVEIERKFLVTGNGWRHGAGVQIRQGYLNHDPERTVRVRVAGGQAFLTIKGITRGASRAEFEYPIPLADAVQLLQLCQGPLLEKRRHTVEEQGRTWEIDEFLGANAGLVVAEIELTSEEQPFARPDWLGREVTAEPRYFNANLAINPYRGWPEPL